jgi:hypothetical protein
MRTVPLRLLLALAAVPGGCATTAPATCPPPTAEAMADCTCNEGGAVAQGSAPVGQRAHLPRRRLAATSGATVDLGEALATAPLTVVTFFSATCPCQRAHDPRLASWQREFAARGVAFYAVDSEAGSSIERDTVEARERAYGFPIVSDPRGEVAAAVGARYATETLVFDRQGTVRFRGGIDSDQNRPHEGAQLWLREALAALVEGRDPEVQSPKSYGCSLRRR